MTNGDLSDITVNNVYSCSFGSGTDCAANTNCDGSQSKTASKNVKDILDNYNNCTASDDQTIRNKAESNLKDAYVALMNELQKTSSNTATSQYDEQIKTLRKDMDDKLKNIYQLDSGKLNEYQMLYQSTLMSGILWGTLSAAAIYYVVYNRE